MLQGYTPVSQLTPSELMELKQITSRLHEGAQAVHLSSGRSVSIAEARSFAPAPQTRQKLYG